MEFREQTIPQLLAGAAVRFGERHAIEDGDVKLTYADVALAAERAARAFCAGGIHPGDRVAVWAPNIYEWILAAVGLQAAGGVLVPLNTRLKGAEAGYILAKSGARMLFTVEEFLGNRYVELLRGAMGGAGTQRPVHHLPALERIVLLRGEQDGSTPWADFMRLGRSVNADEAQRRLAAVGPDDLSDILFTSGTTGKPKGVMTTHAQNLRAFEAWSGIVGLRAGDRYLVVNPFFHSFGYKAGWLACIMRGATILPHQVFDVAAVLQRIAQEKVSVLPGPPTLYQSILAHPKRQEYDLSSLRLVATGAAVIPVELIHSMRRDLHIETIITAYGLTEASGVVTMCRAEDDPETIATTSGRAIPGVEVRCIDTHGAEVPPG